VPIATLTVAVFLVRHPKCVRLDATYLASVVAQANRQVDSDAWGDVLLAVDGADAYAFYTVACSDWGRQAAMDPKEAWATYERLRRAAVIPAMVV
jgi:hypothetical protein